MVKWSAEGLSVEGEDGVWLVRLTGEHRPATVQNLGQALDSLVSTSRGLHRGPRLVVLELCDTGLIESSVVDVIARASHAAQCDPDAHLAVILDSPDGAAARILRQIGLTRLVPTYRGRSVAVADVSSRRPSAVDIG